LKDWGREESRNKPPLPLVYRGKGPGVGGNADVPRAWTLGRTQKPNPTLGKMKDWGKEENRIKPPLPLVYRGEGPGVGGIRTCRNMLVPRTNPSSRNMRFAARPNTPIPLPLPPLEKGKG